MSNTPYSPPHNLNALLIGTGEFSFALGATTPAAAAVQGFRDFGNVKTFKIDSGGDDKEHYGSYRGVLRRDDIRKQKIKLGYTLTNDEWNLNTLLFMLFGTSQGKFTRAAIAAITGTALPFTTGAPSNPLMYYDIMDANGVRVREVTAVTFPSKVEGTDFEVDYKMGRVRFLTAQTASLTPTITAAAVTTSSASSLNMVLPLSQNLFKGIGRLIVFDENAPENIVLEHTDFGCQVEITGTPDVKGDDYSDLTLMVTVTDPVGIYYVREN